MKHKRFGIFGKVFFYTVFITIVVIGIAAALFANQIVSVFEMTQTQQLTNVFQPLANELKGKAVDEMIETAKKFHEKNASFEFCIETKEGELIYKTENFSFIQPGELPSTGRYLFTTKARKINQYQYAVHLVDDIKLYIRGIVSGPVIYNDAIYKTALALLLLLIASILGAAVFAGRIAKPIKRIAYDTKRMSDLESVSAPTARSDEIGQLADDVYKMYDKLKLTIRQLEMKIEHEREMEENQRYFFSAASHELKTPIAATSALLEGMLEAVIQPSEHPQYLRECLKMMNEQNKLISEILEIVKLSDGRITLENERVYLKQKVLDLLPVYQTLADAKEQKIIIDIPEHLCCMADQKLLKKVLTNILMNAVQNTPEQGEIHIYSEEKENNRIRLCILNTDSKIENDILPKLFEPFYRVDKARSRGKGQNGLGLTIVKKALDLMESDFSLENTTKGVLFWLELRKS